ncbi:MAG TPA: glycosyltransferase family 2 protein [Candidatus Bathyarchaeia archaeon]|nr:glycosyltransferase family 2 protein [Candidatus Bathyarchaeia archaeon]
MSRSKKDYSISAPMISYNDETILEDCLASIRSQNYDQKLVNIIIIDGGSTDATLRIAKKYGAVIISRPDLKNQPNIRGRLALDLSRGDLILSLSADNRLQEPDALVKMVETFTDKEIIACQTLRYGYKKTDPILSRYFALIGGCDPIAVGLGKADRGPYDNRNWHSFGTVYDCGEYYKVKFKPDVSKIPTLGANGFLVRRELLEKMDYKENATHIDMCVSLIQQGYNTFAFVKNKHIIHYIDVGVINFLRRKMRYAGMYSATKIERVYGVFHKKDTSWLIWLVFANTTFIVPFSRAIKGYLYVKDIAWFLHPVMCFMFTLGYSWFNIKKFLINIRDKIHIAS